MMNYGWVFIGIMWACVICLNIWAAVPVTQRDGWGYPIGTTYTSECHDDEAKSRETNIRQIVCNIKAIPPEKAK